MTDGDRAWCRGVDKNNLRKKIVEAAGEGNILRLEYLKHKFSLPRDGIVQGLRHAIAHDQAESVKFLVGLNAFGFSSSCDQDRIIVADLFAEAAKAKAQNCFDLLNGFNTLFSNSSSTGYSCLDQEKIASILCTHKWTEPVGRILSKTEAVDKNVFAACLGASVNIKNDTSVLDFVLAWSKKFVGIQDALNTALLDTVSAQDADKIKTLLQKGADPNFDGAQSMLRALQVNRPDIVDLLLQHGFDGARHADDVLKRVGEDKLDPVLRVKLQRQISPSSLEMISDNILYERLALPDGLQITTVFNFASRQQIVISERPHLSTHPMTQTVQNFCDMRDKSVIKQAADKLRALGGKPGECATATCAVKLKMN